MFLGEFNHAIDDKGRLTIPARYRTDLEDGAVVTRGYDQCLFVYTAEAFQKFTDRAQALSPTDPENRALLRSRAGSQFSRRLLSGRRRRW